jgi:hypothetical protein
MKIKYLVFFCLLSISCSQLTYHTAGTSYSELVNIIESSEEDSLLINKAEELLLKKYPRSEKVFELASSEFYEKLYPIWQNDSLKVVLIKDLLKKYNQTDWRRTMYQYLAFSLNELGYVSDLIPFLEEFRISFPRDYLPYYLTARYYLENEIDLDIAELFAEKGFRIAADYPVINFFPPKQWALESRFAPVKTAALSAEIYLKKNKPGSALEILRSTLENYRQTTDDENTLGRVHYLMAETLLELNDTEGAIDAAIRALQDGDSRNYYTSQADSLLKNIISYMNLNDHEFLEFCRQRSGYSDVRFTDVTSQVGLNNISAGRIAWGDFDGDGYVDILLDGSRLFKNEKGIFFSETSVFQDSIKGNGGLWADFDNDGDLDIITKDPESIWLFEDGQFSKVWGNNSLTDNFRSTEGIGVGDINNDGYLDVYLANYEEWKDNQTTGFEDQLFKGIGNGKFLEISDRADILPLDGKKRAGRGVNMADFDNDGDLDIFVSNYRLQDNFLWVNDGSGHFRNEAVIRGVAGDEKDNWWGHTIGSEWADFDNDGDLDLFCANLAHPRYLDISDQSMLYVNSGYPEFSFLDIRAQAGLYFEETHSEPSWADFNNDGWLDLYITSVYPNRRSFLYLNNRNGSFREITFLAGVRHFNGWGNAAADFDNDGDLDLLVAGDEIQLFRNDLNDGSNWLKIHVIGKDHSDAIGSRLTLSQDEKIMIREIQGGKGTTNQHDLVQHFGLGGLKPPFSLEIRFPNGELRSIQIEEVNRKIVIKQ